MTLITRLYIIGVTVALLMANPVSAENITLSDPDQKALSMMSDIMLHLSQFATPPEKSQLQLVINSPTHSAPIKTLAQAIVNIKHHTNLEDKPKLDVIIKDHSIDTNIRNMANILQHINYKPSAADRTLLLEMN